MPNPRSRFAKFEYNAEDYDNSIAIQKFNKAPFREHFMGSRKKILVYDTMIATTSTNNNLILNGLTKSKFIAFLGRFQKQLYKRFRTIEQLYNINIKFKGISRGANTKLWETMKPGRYFYNIDLKKAYWQIGNKLGYLDYNLFNDYIENDAYKSAMRYCFSFLARKNYMVYHGPKGDIKMMCDTSALNKVYENIRHQLYNEIASAKKGCKNVVEWNIDGVSVLSSEVDQVCKRFKDAGLLYKITECRKIDEYTYSSGNKIKNFKRKPKS
ncbi:MAG: hypothetical protein V4506_16030 [Bacteroidota bacterium]